MKPHLPKTVLLALLVLTSYSGLAAGSALLNGDFASFDGWTATKTNENPSGTFNTLFLVDDAQIATDPQFVRDSPAAGLADMRNDPIAPTGYFELSLFQEFDLPADAIGLSFNFDWRVSNIAVDLVQASLWTASFGAFLENLLGAVTFAGNAQSGNVSVDISAYAGQTVAIEFLLQDGDRFADAFAIGDIVVRQSSVPEPPSIVAFALGFIALTAMQAGRRRGAFNPLIKRVLRQ